MCSGGLRRMEMFIADAGIKADTSSCALGDTLVTCRKSVFTFAMDLISAFQIKQIKGPCFRWEPGDESTRWFIVFIPDLIWSQRHSSCLNNLGGELMFDICLWGKWFIGFTGEKQDIQSTPDISGLNEPKFFLIISLNKVITRLWNFLLLVDSFILFPWGFMNSADSSFKLPKSLTFFFSFM